MIGMPRETLMPFTLVPLLRDGIVMEAAHFHGDVALVVIHGDTNVVGATDCFGEKSVRGLGAVDVQIPWRLRLRRLG
jgi:hypothetical protein